MAKKQTRKKATRGATKRARPARRASAGARRTAKKKTARKGAPRRTAARGARTTARRGGARKRSSSARRSGRARGGQLSRSAQTAEWIESPGDRAERPGQTLATRSHEVIQQWAAERGAEPATVPGADPGQPRVLRLNFPGFGGENLEPVSWDDWFRTFDERNLVFVFQDRLKNGNQSNFFRFDSPEREDA